MSRRVKLVLVASLTVAAVGAGAWAWFLSGHGLGEDSAWASVLQGFTALLGIPALVVGVLALRSPGDDGSDDRIGGVQRVKIGRIKASGPVHVDVRQDNRP